MMNQLEVTAKLERMAKEGTLVGNLAILNLPSMFACEKTCYGCPHVGMEALPSEAMSIDDVKKVINYFVDNEGTRIITINGRGDPFHPDVVDITLGKIEYATSHGLMSYVFTDGTNLTDDISQFLAENKVNVMMSMYSEPRLGPAFLTDPNYGAKPKHHERGVNLKKLVEAYEKSPHKLREHTTRLGFNYVISEEDLDNSHSRLYHLWGATFDRGIYFQVNTNFVPHPDSAIQKRLEREAIARSSSPIPHSTFLKGVCQMGAGSSATVDYNGQLFRCPYMTGRGDGNFFHLLESGHTWSFNKGSKLKEVLARYSVERTYRCILRKTPILKR